MTSELLPIFNSLPVTFMLEK